MQNIKVKDAVEQGVFHCASATHVLQGYVALEDLAAVSELVLLNLEEHNRARYELVGQNASLEEVAGIISKCAGKTIPAELVPRDQVGLRALLPTKAQTAFAQEGLDRMLFYYDRRYAGVCRKRHDHRASACAGSLEYAYEGLSRG